MKRKYDFVFSLGGSCKGNMSLREAGLQHLSFPLDWCGGPRLVDKARHINSGFEDFLNVENLEKLPVAKGSQTQLYQDRKLGYTIIHEFHVNVPFERELPIVREKFKRRISRFLGLLDRSKTVLVTWVNVKGAPTETPVEAQEFRSLMQAQRPGTRFDVLLFNHDPGRSVSDFTDREEDGVRVVGFDYENHKASNEFWEADQKVLGKWLAAQYETDDYRTDAERAAWVRKQATAKYDRFKAKNWLDYVCTKFRYKLYVHLRKRMERKGLV